jgi:cell shape-determining protein MreC
MPNRCPSGYKSKDGKCVPKKSPVRKSPSNPKKDIIVHLMFEYSDSNGRNYNETRTYMECKLTKVKKKIKELYETFDIPVPTKEQLRRMKHEIESFLQERLRKNNKRLLLSEKYEDNYTESFNLYVVN